MLFLFYCLFYLFDICCAWIVFEHCMCLVVILSESEYEELPVYRYFGKSVELMFGLEYVLIFDELDVCYENLIWACCLVD